MGRKSLEATNVRFIRCARAAVTFLRGRWLVVAVVDFLCVVVLDLCLVLLVVVLVEDFFFFGADALSCASSPPASRTSRKTGRIAKRQLRVLTLFSVARFLVPAFLQFVTEWIPICNIRATGASVQ